MKVYTHLSVVDVLGCKIQSVDLTYSEEAKNSSKPLKIQQQQKAREEAQIAAEKNQNNFNREFTITA